MALILDLEEQLERYFEKNVHLLEDEMNVEVCLGAIGGSYLIGFENCTSDYDYHFICKGDIVKRGRRIERKIEIDAGEIVGHIWFVSLDNAYKQINDYRKKYIKYPSCLYREKDVTYEDLLDSEYSREVLYYVIMADRIWKRNSIITPNDCKMLHNAFRLMDVLDMKYSQLYGSYNKQIKGCDKILVRKYLHALHHIFTCLWVISNKSKPPILFKDLLGQCEDRCIRKEVENLLEMNFESTITKEKFYVNQNSTINSYIETMLEYIRREMEENENIYLDSMFGIDIC